MDNMENKIARLLVVPLRKALSGVTPSWCGRQEAANSYGALIALCDRRINKIMLLNTKNTMLSSRETGFIAGRVTLKIL